MAVQDMKELGDQVRDTEEANNVDQTSEDRPNTTETTMQAEGENRSVDPYTIPGYLQDLFANFIASMKVGNAELVRSVEQKKNESNKELHSSVEQRMKESSDQMGEEIRKENEKPLEQFRLENQKLSKEFSG
jgi:hypothetical protein